MANCTLFILRGFSDKGLNLGLRKFREFSKFSYGLRCVKVKVLVYSFHGLVLAVAAHASHNSIGITLPHSEGME